MPDNPSNPGRTPPPRRPAIFAAGLLLVALALVVLYTSRRAFLSPVALVVVAAIGVAALLIQIHLRPNTPSSVQASSARAPLFLSGIGVAFAVAAVFGDAFHLNPALMLIAALAAIVSFAVSGIIVLISLRKPRA